VTRRPRARPSALLAHALVALLIVAGVALRVVDFPVAVYTPDEDAYADFYAAPLYAHGLGGLPTMVRDYEARSDMREFPSPTRVGHLWAMVLAMHLAGHASIQVAAAVSAVASGLILVVIAGLGLPLLGPWPTAAALLLAVVSPLDRAMARRAWGDELLALCALVSMAALARHAARPRARWMALALAAAGYAILVKETGLVLLLLATVWLAVTGARVAGVRGALRALLAGALTLIATLGVLAIACGGLAPLRATFAGLVASGPLNAYMREYQSGGPGYYARGLLRVEPVTIVLGALGAVLAAAWRLMPRAASAPDGGAPERARPAAICAGIAWLTLGFAGMALAWPQKNLRFLSPVYAPLDLLAGAALGWLLASARERLPAAAFRVLAAVVVAGLIAAALADQRRFVELFIRRGIPDLATPWFTR
jgi:hypothetical protein